MLLLKASPAKRLLYDFNKESAIFVCASPSKTSDYQKYHRLVEEGKPIDFNLPYYYRILCEIFKSEDRVVAILYNYRKQVITFSKLKKAIQETIRRTFIVDYLALINLSSTPLSSFNNFLFKNEGIKF